MKGTFVIIPLSAEPSYEVSVNLGKNAYTFRFSVNTRQNKYHFDVFKDDGTPVFTGLPLLPMMYEVYKFPETGGTLAMTKLDYATPVNFEDIAWNRIPEYYTLFYTE